MLTGVTPDIHGVTWNDYRPDRGALPVPTVFTIARANGLTTAMVVAKEKLRTLALDGSVGIVEVVAGDAVQVATVAARYIESAQPNLFFVHFADPDGAGHQSGWGSAAQVASLERCDRAIGVLLGAIQRAGIASQSVMIVTADHGGEGKSHDKGTPLCRTIPWICAGTGVATRHELRDQVSTCDTAAMALWALGIRPPAGWTGRVLPGVFPRRG
jgi:predicted AlkP superfamily pyrophosphatase or phosphodiesterase